MFAHRSRLFITLNVTLIALTPVGFPSSSLRDDGVRTLGDYFGPPQRSQASKLAVEFCSAAKHRCLQSKTQTSRVYQYFPRSPRACIVPPVIFAILRKSREGCILLRYLVPPKCALAFASFFDVSFRLKNCFKLTDKSLINIWCGIRYYY